MRRAGYQPVIPPPDARPHADGGLPTKADSDAMVGIDNTPNSRPERTLAILLLTSLALVVAGFATLSIGLALMTAGVGLAAWAWLFFGDIPDSPSGSVSE